MPGCAGPELIQEQELLSTRVRLGLPQVRRFAVAVVEHRFGSLAEICDLLSQHHSPAAGIVTRRGWQRCVARASLSCIDAMARPQVFGAAHRQGCDDCHDRGNIDCSDWAEEGECDSDEMRD